MSDKPASRTRGAKRRRDDTESLRQDYECPVCMELPAGAVHRCAKGHRICGACDERLETRRCPVCRVALPPVGDPWRDRERERAIAQLPASCAHCGLGLLQSALAGHELRCALRPCVCDAHEAGCAWTGVGPDAQTAHENTCPFMIAQRAVAPLRAENKELTERLRQVHAEVRGLRAQLRARAGALEPRVAALEHGDATAASAAADAASPASGGGRGGRGRGRGGRGAGRSPSLHLALRAEPSVAEVERLPLRESVATLRVWSGNSTHHSHADVVLDLCRRLFQLSTPPGSEQPAADAGAIEALCAALRALPSDRQVQSTACGALHNVIFGGSPAAASRKGRAVAAGITEAVAAAMWSHPGDQHMQRNGCLAFLCVAHGQDDGAEGRRQRAAAAGALECVVAAMTSPSSSRDGWSDVTDKAAGALLNLCGGPVDSAGAEARKERAVAAGALGALVAAMGRHSRDAELNQECMGALVNITAGDSPAAFHRRLTAMQQGVRAAIGRAANALPEADELQERAALLLQRLPASPGAFIHSMMSAAFSHGGGGPASFFESLNNAMPFPGIPANMPPGMHQAFLAGMLQAANAAGASPDGPESVAGTHEETDDDEGEGELVD